VHKLVAEAFIGPCPPRHQVRHLNGICTDNRVANLCYGTCSENQADKERHGRVPKGEKHKQHRLTEAQVAEVRLLLAQGFTKSAIGLRFGVSSTTIYWISSGRNWRWLK
jgi:hypothetical protein